MEQKDLIEEIVARVAAKMASLEGQKPQQEAEPAVPACDDRPGLLILRQDHGDVCHDLYDSERLAKQFKTDCALLHNYEVNMDDYEVVILFDLTNDALAKLATGICDTPYTRLASQALLMGKRIYVPCEQVELYRYAKTAPKPYYAMLQERLALLTASGLVVCKLDDLENCILDEQSAPSTQEEVPHECQKEQKPLKEFRLSKRVITERDISEACAAKANCIYIPARSIVTDLAKDYARTRDISLIRE